MSKQPPIALKCVIASWGVISMTFAIWNAISTDLLSTLRMLLTFDEAWLSSNSVMPILGSAGLTLVWLLAVPVVGFKTWKGSVEAKSTFMVLNFVHIGSIVWGAFHLSSFVFLLFALAPIAILITMVSSEEIGKYFASQQQSSELKQ